MASAALSLALLATPAMSQVPNPTVTGPIPSTAPPGDPSRNYIFFATWHDLASYGYVEEEFFVEGLANRYITTGGAQGVDGTIQDSNHPYKTRIVVRRPATAQGFNGVVVLEWQNVTNGLDMENTWFQIDEHLLRSGYAWVGVSVQRTGVNRLRTWNPDRYGTLDVSQRNAQGQETITNDALRFDILGQVTQAIKSPVGVNPLGPLAAQMVIATGHSQSSSSMSGYINSIDPLHQVIDAYALHGSLGNAIRTSLRVPVAKVLSEYDVRALEFPTRRPDDAMFRTWEVTGTSHNDRKSYVSRVFHQLRDIGTFVESALNCTFTPGSEVPFHYVMAAAIDGMVTWVNTGTPLPSAPLLQFSQTTQPRQLALDALGNALGGIRQAHLEVPIAVHSGTGPGPGTCDRWGYTNPFSNALLTSLYPPGTHTNYVAQVTAVTEALLDGGFIVEADAARTIADAQASAVGRAFGDVTGDDLVNCQDLQMTKASIGRRTGQPGYVPTTDVDGNGVIDIRDIAAISRTLPLGTTCN